MRLLLNKETWCRDAKCKYHPADKLIKISLNFIRCFGCKLYISKDFHENVEEVNPARVG